MTISKLSKMKSALAFYAHEENHYYSLDYDMCDMDESEVTKDYGNKAGHALDVFENTNSIDVLKTALNFYAKEENHYYSLDYDMCDVDESEVTKDYGKKARSALNI